MIIIRFKIRGIIDLKMRQMVIADSPKDKMRISDV